jgi:hypothetical protein
MKNNGYKYNESTTKFKTRVYCNIVCLNSDEDLDNLKLQRGKDKREQVKRECEVCHGEMIRGRTETTTTFAERFTCSNKCAGIRRHSKSEEENKKAGKQCKNPKCGRTFYRRSTGESWTRFNARETCSVSCAHVHRTGKSPNPNKKPKTSNKRKVVSTLPPVSPPPTYIPPAPQPQFERVWRPGSWGGEFVRRVS